MKEGTQTVDLIVEDLEFVAPAPTARELRRSVTRLRLLRLAQQGVTATKAATILGISPDQARVHYSDQTFQDEVLGRVSKAFSSTDARMFEAQRTLSEKLEDKANRAFDVLSELLERSDIRVETRARIAQDFLDRRPDSSKISTSIKAELDPVVLARVARTAAEMDASRPSNVVSIKKAV